MENTVPDVNALSELRSILGPKGYSDDQDVISPWLTDWRGRFTGAAAALLSPATTEEVAAIVRVAAKYRLSLVPQGGNSGMVAGATPNSSGNQLILSMRRMNNITAIDADAGLISCEAGVILQNLHEAAVDIQKDARYAVSRIVGSGCGKDGIQRLGGRVPAGAARIENLAHRRPMMDAYFKSE